MTMHLAQGLSTISTRKRKVKITKARMAELHEQWLAHNKRCKQTHMHDMRYDTLEEYIDYCYGRVKKPDPRDRKHFKPLQRTPTWRDIAMDDHRQKYPSMDCAPIGGGCRKKESPKYTGTLIKGIATMHKSNAVPVIDDQHAKDIARMRR